MPGAGRSEPRAAEAGLALPSAPALHQSPQQGLSLHLFCFTQDTVGHWGLIPSLSSIKACGAMLWAPLALQLPLPTSQCRIMVFLLLHRVPHLGLVLVGGEGALCESSTIQSLTIVLLHSPTVPFPRWGWCWKHSSTPELSQHSPRVALTLHSLVWVHTCIPE